MEAKPKKYRIKEVKKDIFIPEVSYTEDKFKGIHVFKDSILHCTDINDQIKYCSKPTYGEALELINHHKEFTRKKEELEENSKYHYIDN